MKILQVNKFYYPWIGGVEDHVRTLTEQLALKNKLTVLTIKNSLKKPKKKFNYKLIESRNICHLLQKDSILSMPISIDFILKFRKLYLKQDIIHIHLPNPWAVITVMFFTKADNLIVTYHSDIKKQKFFLFFYRPLLKKFLRERVSKIITTSDNLKKNSAILKKFKSKTVVVPLGIDLNSLQENKVFYKKLKAKYQNTPVVLFVGRLVYYKGCEYLIKAFKQLTAKAQLLIIGEGKLKNDLVKLVNKLGINDRVRFISPLPRDYLNAYYKLADIFVLPSIAETEAYGLVQLEAMYHKTAVISTNLPTGVPFVNKNNQTGYVVPPKNSKRLKQKIDRLLTEKARLTRFKNAGHQRVLKYFNSSKMADEIIKIYQSN